MSTTVTANSTLYTATEIDGYKAERESRNILHSVINTNEPSVVSRAAGLRSGSLSLWFDSFTTAAGLFDALSTAGTFSFASTDVPTLNMSFVLDGSVSLEVAETRSDWVVTFDFQEVAT